jgi:hypothetical protein
MMICSKYPDKTRFFSLSTNDLAYIIHRPDQSTLGFQDKRGRRRLSDNHSVRPESKSDMIAFVKRSWPTIRWI